jgi:hypothetical protein
MGFAGGSMLAKVAWIVLISAGRSAAAMLFF